MGGRSGGQFTSFLGDYDREIDTDDEEIEFEEHFILKVPEGKPAEEMMNYVADNGKGKNKAAEELWFKFKGVCDRFLASLRLLTSVVGI